MDSLAQASLRMECLKMVFQKADGDMSYLEAARRAESLTQYVLTGRLPVLTPAVQ